MIPATGHGHGHGIAGVSPPYSSLSPQHPNHHHHNISLASKLHAFGGAVLTPEHARNLTPGLALSLASALSHQAAAAASNRGLLPPGANPASVGAAAFHSARAYAAQQLQVLPSRCDSSSTLNSEHTPGGGGGGVGGGKVAPHASAASGSGHNHSPGSLSTDVAVSTVDALELWGSWRIQYTVWITEAWNVLRWAEPTAALFWEMATMYHTLHVAALSAAGGGSGSAPSPAGGSRAGPSAGRQQHPPAKSPSSREDASGSGQSTSTVQTHIPPILSCGSQSSVGSNRSGNGSAAGEASTSGGVGIGGPGSLGGVGEASGLGREGEGSVPSVVMEGGANGKRQQGRGMKPARHSAKELPVWLISMFLLLHCEDQAYLRCVSGEDERRFGGGAGGTIGAGGDAGDGGASVGGADSLDFNALLLHQRSSLSPRTRLHAGAHHNNADCASFLLRHLRKFLLLCAVPRNVDACRAVHSLAAPPHPHHPHSHPQHHHPNHHHPHRDPSAGTTPDLDYNRIGRLHDEEHRRVGTNVQLALEELDRLNLVLQAPSGGPVDEPPVAIGEHLRRCIAAEQGGCVRPPTTAGASATIALTDAERILRRYLEAELDLAKQELEGGGEVDDAEHGHDDAIAPRMQRMSLGGEGGDATSAPLSPPRSRTPSVAESSQGGEGGEPKDLKELSYRRLRSTTVLLEQGRFDGANGSPSNRSSSDASSRENDCSRLHDLHVAYCTDTHFYLLQPFEHATIAACTGCTIVVGAVAGLLHVVDCERTSITSAARRVVVSNSSDVVHYLFTPSPPLLVGDNRGCQFAPYNTYYDGLRGDLLATGLAAALRSTNSGEPLVPPPSPAMGGDGAGRGASPPPPPPALQCASNKWSASVELSKLEVSQLPSIQGAPGSPTAESPPTSPTPSPGADDKVISSADLVMQSSVLLPASNFDILLVPVETEEAQTRRRLLTEAEERRGVGVDDGTDPSVGGDAARAAAGESQSQQQRAEGSAESEYCRNLTDLLTLSPFHMPHEYERRAIVKAERVRALQQAMVTDLTDQQRLSLEEELNRGFREWLVTSGNLRQVLDLVHLERRVVS